MGGKNAGKNIGTRFPKGKKSESGVFLVFADLRYKAAFQAILDNGTTFA